MTSDKQVKLQRVLDDFIYTCGSKLHDLQVPQEFENVEVKDHSCHDPIEKLYYSVKFDPICIYCGRNQLFTSENVYPKCTECDDIIIVFVFRLFFFCFFFNMIVSTSH